MLLASAGCLPTVTMSRERMRNQGILVANIGMTYQEVQKRSTYGIGEGSYFDKGLDGTAEFAPRHRLFARDNVKVDWEVAGTGLRFTDCGYYWLQTDDNDDPHIVSISVGTAKKLMTWEEFKADVLDVQRRLHADGWKPVRYSTGRTADEVLHEMLEKPKIEQSQMGAVTYGKGDVALSLYLIKQSSPTASQDPLAAADFIHRVELEPRSAWEAADISGDILPK